MDGVLWVFHRRFVGRTTRAFSLSFDLFPLLQALGEGRGLRKVLEALARD